MEEFVVKEGKVPFIVGGVCAILFFLMLLVSTISSLADDDIGTFIFCFIVFGGFTFLGMALVGSYLFRRLSLSRNECYYQTSFRKKKIFYLNDIEKCVFDTGNNQGKHSQYRLFDRNNQCLARFEANMVGITHALSFLHEMGIRFEPRKEFGQIGKLFKPRNESQDEVLDIMERFDADKVVQLKKYLKIVQIINIVILVLSFFVFSYRMKLIVYMLTPLFWYIVYVVIYPIMVIEFNKNSRKRWQQFHVEIPYLPLCFSIVILAMVSDAGNIKDDMKFWLFVVIMASILFLLFAFVGYKRDHKIKKRKWFSIYGALLVYTFSSAYAWNWVCRVKEPVHESVVVVEKKIYHSRTGNDYNLKLQFVGGDFDEVETSSSLYNSIKEGDYVQLCKRESVFGISYWYVHL